jgi:Piwi domain
MIDDLSPMMVERLQLFKEKRNRLPDRIVVFRDGVSEGQFVTVLREECKPHGADTLVILSDTFVQTRSSWMLLVVWEVLELPTDLN